MKKLLLIPALLLGSIGVAQEYKYEITPVIGYNIAEGNLNLKDQFLAGAEFQINTDTFLKPEFSVLFTDTDYEDLPVNPSTDIWRFAFNGVHDFDAIGAFTPLFKVGVGYEYMDETLADNDNALFVNAGVGVKTFLADNLALKLEAIYMNKEFDSNFAVLAGVSYAFGPKAQQVPPAPVDGDDDNDGVLNSVDQCPNTPAGVKVDASGCKVDGDDDNDGVLNSKDKCPNTP
ncbi:thrombospondin type 3 repeat-containing protein, partial [Sulfurimonas sp.]|uniref:outer membrane protein n=1 Tax=Sulfurimonas sp. TaxID=2022749 RepID=UPI00263965E3